MKINKSKFSLIFLCTIGNQTVTTMLKLLNQPIKHIQQMKHIQQIAFTSNSILFKNCSNTTTKEDEGYVPIYKFESVKVLAVMNRLKLYQTAITGVAIPGSCILRYMDIIQNEGLLFAAYTSL